jgi:hypothetical protein
MLLFSVNSYNWRPEAKQRLPMKRPAAPDPGPSPKQRSTVLPLRTPMGNPVEPDVLPEDTETRALHRQHVVHSVEVLTETPQVNM